MTHTHTTDSNDGLSAYDWLIDSWAERSIGDQGYWFDSTQFLTKQVNAGHSKVTAAVRCREELLTDSDMDFCRPLIESGFLSAYSESFASALLVTSREMQQRRQQIELLRNLALYQPKVDALILSCPGIESEVSKHKEMVSVSNLQQIDRSAAFAFNGALSNQANAEVKLTSLLNPELVNFVLKSGFPKSTVEIRLDPDYPSSSADPPFATYTPELPSLILEVLKNVPLKRFLGLKTYAAPQPASITENPQAAFEYFSQGLRSLEAWGSRDGDRTEIYIEELIATGAVRFGETRDELTVSSDGEVIGRMIHCDTTAENDALCDKVDLCHLDLAINVYEGETGRRRLNTPPTSRVSTSKRIHLFKATPIPLNLLPGIAYLFFTRSPRQLLQFFKKIIE